MSSISILIITYNRAHDLLIFLESLVVQKDLSRYVAETLILNNASTESYDEVKEFIVAHPEMSAEFIDHHENLGVARGRNHLIKKAKSPYLLVLDDDVLFETNDSIIKISSLFNKPQYIENNTAVITLNIHYWDTKERQKSALPHKHYEEYKNKEWFFTYYFTGAAHLMRSELFQKTGYYPENFFYGMEEYDLSYRIIDAGYTLAYDNSVLIWHKESPWGRQPNHKKVQMQWVNKSIVAWRYLPFIYFISTAFMWNLQFLKLVPTHLFTYVSSGIKVFSIPFREKRKVIGKNALLYLKAVKARLWY